MDLADLAHVANERGEGGATMHVVVDEREPGSAAVPAPAPAVEVDVRVVVDSDMLEATAPEAGAAVANVLDPRFGEYRKCGDRRIRDALIEEHRWMAVYCARRFQHRGEPLEDLIQVGMLGILKAVERFDPSFGVVFATFAMPTIMGELRRHFRDHTWPVRVPRRVKELHLELAGATEQLSQDLGRPPIVEELAERLRASVEEVLEAMEAGAAYHPAPLTPPRDADDDDQVAQDAVTLGGDDPRLAGSDIRLTVEALLNTLPTRERQVIQLRFFEQLTQAEIALHVGISQVHVSRVLRHTLNQLHLRLNAADRAAVGP
jgi:RNA polymerase sigma-B factor